MVDQSSGTYIVNKEYDIVSYNQTAIDLYPQLKKGEKCYKCLMGLDSPCPPCPIANHIKGPKTYFDPIRKIYETVDAVPFVSEEGIEDRYALVFSTVGERERFSKQLPNTEAEFNSLYEQEYYDRLTGGFSEKGFVREAEKILKESEKDEQFVVLYFNIRNFKAINDLFGFEGGDTLLCQIYLLLEEIKGNLVHSRISGDRFVVLIKQKDLDFEYITHNSVITWTLNGKRVRVYSRWGVYLVEDKTMSVAGMIDRARIAKNNIADEYIKPYAVFDERMRKEYVDQAQILADYEEALKKEEFLVYYQPVVNTITGEVASAEALVRWKHPERGMIMPNMFIPVLEKSGYITKVDHYVARQVYEKMRERQYQSQKIVPVSFNLSWMDLYDEEMKDFLAEKIQGKKVPEGFLRIETTETALNSMEEISGEFLESLRKCGSKILLDDFGSGYSSFSMIQKYEFDILKIDKEFVREIESSPKTRNIICAIIAMCHEMNISVIAEGVETKVEYEFLQLNGCDYIQGYFVAKPMPEEEFYRYLDEHKVIKEESAYFNQFINRNLKTEDVERFGADGLQDIILDSSDRFIQVCDPETMEIYYANKATRMISGNPNADYRGEKCHKYMLGLDEMCPHCPIRLMGKETERQLEINDGKNIFSLYAKYIHWKGKRLFMEMGMDVTELKKLKEKYDSQILSILKSFPEEQGIFYMDVTSDQWISSNGKAKVVREFQNITSIDMLIRQVALLVPEEEGQERFFEIFCRSSILKAIEEGKKEICLETLAYHEDKSIRWFRVILHLLENPVTKHIEAILHGVDISREKEEDKQKLASKLELQRVIDKYHKADKDRRIDFLTGLQNRLELFEHLQRAVEESDPKIQAMFMLDVDDFKSFNDRHGHLAGDECLQRISEALSRYGKENGVIFFRYGGEEILATYAGGEKEPSQIGEEILKTIRNLKIHRRDEYGDMVTVSLGYTTDNSRYEKMIDKANQAMYQAKANGKNQIICYEK